MGIAARRSIVAVTSQLPWPLDSGGHLRSFHLLRGLSQAFDVDLIAPVLRQHDPSIAALADAGIRVHPVVVPPRTMWREAGRVLRSAAAGQPYVLFRRHAHQLVRAALGRHLAHHGAQLLYLDHLDSLVYASEHRGIPVMADLHNSYSALARRAGEEHPSYLRRQYLRREARLLASVECREVPRLDVVTTVSDQDDEYYRRCGARRTFVVPNGVDCEPLQSLPEAERPADAPLILYVGAMSWGPNAAAAVFLARHVLPRVQQRLPNARLRIVGRDPSADVMALAALPGVTVTGSVPDMLPHLAQAHVLAVPLEAGGGTRLKILEAFAAGVPVVSTAVGCEGLRTQDGVHLLVAERDLFADALIEVLTNPTKARQLAVAARLLALESYDWRSIVLVAREAAAAALDRRPLRRASTLTVVRKAPSAAAVARTPSS